MGQMKILSLLLLLSKEWHEYGKSAVRLAAWFSPRKWPCVCVPGGYKLRRFCIYAQHSLPFCSLGVWKGPASPNPPIYLTTTAAAVIAHHTAVRLKHGGWSCTAIAIWMHGFYTHTHAEPLSMSVSHWRSEVHLASVRPRQWGITGDHRHVLLHTCIHTHSHTHIHKVVFLLPALQLQSCRGQRTWLDGSSLRQSVSHPLLQETKHSVYLHLVGPSSRAGEYRHNPTA